MKKILWFARGGGIAKMGPFQNQVEATNALRLAKGKEPDERSKAMRDVFNAIAASRPHLGLAPLPLPPTVKSSALFPDDAFVWPEEVEVEGRVRVARRTRRKR